MNAARKLVLATGLCALAACGTSPARTFAEPPRMGTRVQSTEDLRTLPAPLRPAAAQAAGPDRRPA